MRKKKPYMIPSDCVIVVYFFAFPSKAHVAELPTRRRGTGRQHELLGGDKVVVKWCFKLQYRRLTSNIGPRRDGHTDHPKIKVSSKYNP